ncbi:uncharacterized protein LOC116298519 [Actinia tenebrosa]|uniref:Uncharacterized protein LOC116298519 n=1 Tax=Actinia tenebrosa TaxID=6105 RepID=A0A6P8I4R7_ACTTE|nr:uncharacterized protein LOC116298519 [Actinia tenebrosa]
MSGAQVKTTETRQSLLPRNLSSYRKEMQKHEVSSVSDLYDDTNYSDKFRKFSRAFFDEADDCESIELDFNFNSKSGKSKKNRRKSANKAPQDFITYVIRMHDNWRYICTNTIGDQVI